MQALKDMASGLKFDIELYFSMGSGLSTLEGMVQVIWKNDYDECGEYKYGLKFVQISKESCLKLKHLLRNKMVDC